MKLNGQIVTLEHESRILEGNPLGDPTVRDLIVYLPPQYEDSDLRFPVIWALPPFTSWGEKLFNVQAWDANLPQRADRIISEAKMAPVIIAFPDCFTKYGGSQYINASATGRYEDYLVEELVPTIDDRFRTLASRDHRAVMGHSSGGYGALMLAMRHSDVFVGAASHSGDLAFEYCYMPDIPGAVRYLSACGGVDLFLKSIGGTTQSKDWFSALVIIAMSACYSPNQDSPYGFDLPCDPYMGEMNDEVWQRWLEYDPVRLVEDKIDPLRGLRALYLDCGTRDEYNLFLGARMLHALLESNGIKHTYEEFEGGHHGNSWRFETSLPFLSAAITPSK